jgi:peptidoglycan-associated lipoprotein
MRNRVIVMSTLLAAAATAACHHAPPPIAAATPTAAVPPPARNAATGPAAQPVTQPAMTDAGAAERSRALAATLGERIHFDYNIADLRPEDRAVLDMKARILRANRGVRIRITGNCDERGSDAYNIALGMRRAAAAKEYLGTAGIDASRIDVSSLGREKPIDPASTDAAWAKNRRDEFEIVTGGAMLVAP